LAALVEEIERENRNPHGTEKADRAFHLAIARATRNAAVAEAVERLWNLRADPRKRAAARKGPQRQHQAGGRGTHRRSRSPARPRPAAARAAMPLASVLDSLSLPPRKRPSPKHAAHPGPQGSVHEDY
jgi:GntR family transcriptional repressor for pyruvate dehydrogenase complex